MTSRQASLLIFLSSWQDQYEKNSPEMNAIIVKMLDGISEELLALETALKSLLDEPLIWRKK